MAMVPRPRERGQRDAWSRRSRTPAASRSGGRRHRRCGRREPSGLRAARPDERGGDQQRRHEKAQLADGERRRMQDVIDQPARRRGARAGIGEGQEIVAHEPDEMRRHHDERDDAARSMGPAWPAPCAHRGRTAGTARAAAPARRRNTSPTAPARRARPSSSQWIMRPRRKAGMKGVAGERPERQLDDVVIELGGGVMEVVQAIEDQDGDQRADRADQRTRGQPDQRERGDHRELRQRVIGGVEPDQPVQQLDQPPRQRRQLVVAELPFAAIGQRLDQIERQIGIEQRRQRGPDQTNAARGTRRRPPADGARWSRSVPASMRQRPGPARFRFQGLEVEVGDGAL